MQVSPDPQVAFADNDNNGGRPVVVVDVVAGVVVVVGGDGGSALAPESTLKSLASGPNLARRSSSRPADI